MADPPHDFETWAKLAALTSKLGPARQPEALEKLDVVVDDFRASDAHWGRELTQDVVDRRDDRLNRYAAICGEVAPAPAATPGGRATLGATHGGTSTSRLASALPFRAGPATAPLQVPSFARAGAADIDAAKAGPPPAPRASTGTLEASSAGAESLPFIRTAEAEGLTLQRYAELTVELDAAPRGGGDAVLARHGLDDAGYRAAADAYRARFLQDPALREAWFRACAERRATKGR